MEKIKSGLALFLRRPGYPLVIIQDPWLCAPRLPGVYLFGNFTSKILSKIIVTCCYCKRIINATVKYKKKPVTCITVLKWNKLFLRNLLCEKVLAMMPWS